ncbi:S-formylglutathione hydrolase [Actinoalloteichus hoggarensis]|uniref:S-formylglutathione hydrolase n=1 Tax=Actinoalloteichus hoggarensis TaxID=1470176 RepID=A0A221W5T1_9PSEU|nr:alpha/beta hydrolase-fold protein [Actinoalloteichus hoggarensis]ASO21046.1 S-formylglutathione hydrolase [Actinoalloteichus hoggarensis]MBB5920977.1 S-formylglutathione hydrolase [Actinoalloteichus hoggarensis]
MSTATLRVSRRRLPSTAVGEDVEYRVLVPSDHRDGERLPLLLHLHGALSSSASLEQARPLYQQLFDVGEFPRAVVACPSTPTSDGFYLDRAGGPRWESLVGDELPAHLAATVGPLGGTALLGASMGGYGALKIAFAAPERFAAVVALSPAVFPGETPVSVPEANRPSILGELHAAMGADLATYQGNCVHGRARRHAAELRAGGLAILLDCGAADEFLLHHGAAHLHGILTELGIAHSFRLVEGAGHVGHAAEARTRDAIRFVGAAITALGAPEPAGSSTV